MKILKCKVCGGEADVIGNDRSINKLIKCSSCGFTNSTEPSKKNTEVVIIRRPNRK